MAAEVATWKQTVVAGSTTTTGTAWAATSLSVTPGARLARVIVRIYAAGCAVSTTSPLSLSAINSDLWVELAGGSYGPRDLHRSQSLVPFSTSAVYDPMAAVGARTVWYMHHGGGYKELGCDLQTSYGDGSKLAGTVTIKGGFYNIVGTANNFVVTRTIVLRLLEFK